MLRESNPLRPTVFAVDLPPMNAKSSMAARAPGRVRMEGAAQKHRASGEVPQAHGNEGVRHGSRSIN